MAESYTTPMHLESNRFQKSEAKTKQEEAVLRLQEAEAAIEKYRTAPRLEKIIMDEEEIEKEYAEAKKEWEKTAGFSGGNQLH